MDYERSKYLDEIFLLHARAKKADVATLNSFSFYRNRLKTFK